MWKIVPSFGLISFILIIAFWIYLIFYSYRHKEKSTSPWGFGIVIIGIFLKGREITFSSHQTVVFAIDIALVVSLFGVLWNISNIRNLFTFRNLQDIFRYLGLGLIFGLLFGSYFLSPQGMKYIKVDYQSGTIVALISYVMQASLVEEFLYRGFLLNYLRKCNFNLIFSIAFQALIFTLFHVEQHVGDWMGILQIFMVGVTIGYLTWKSNSLIPAYLLHSVTNLMVIVWLLPIH